MSEFTEAEIAEMIAEAAHEEAAAMAEIAYEEA